MNFIRMNRKGISEFNFEESFSQTNNNNSRSRKVLLQASPLFNYDANEDRSSPISTSPPEGTDLFVALKNPLRVGAFLGLIPIQNLRESKTGKQAFSWIHWRTWLCALICLLIGANVFFIGYGFVTFLIHRSSSSGAGSIVRNLSGVWFYTAGMAVYIFFLVRSKKLCAYFYDWQRISFEIQQTVLPDKSLSWHINLITLIVLGSCLGENIMFHSYIMKNNVKEHLVQGDLRLLELLEDYYLTNGYIHDWFSFNPFISLAMLIVNKWTLYAWNFGDVILMLISRALYGRFEGFNSYLESQMVQDGAIEMIRKGALNWKEVRDNFLSLVRLLEEANEIFSPLLWLSYVTDIFFVCNQLYIELSTATSFSPSDGEKSFGNSVYVLWSFLHLVIRTLSVNMIAAKVNQAAHRLTKLTQHVYPEDYNNDVKRLEKYLHGKVIGLSGNGCFVITGSFILMIVSAIFTLEVVLLQNTPKTTV